MANNGYDQSIDTEELKKYIQGTDSITGAFGEHWISWHLRVLGRRRRI